MFGVQAGREPRRAGTTLRGPRIIQGVPLTELRYWSHWVVRTLVSSLTQWGTEDVGAKLGVRQGGHEL